MAIGSGKRLGPYEVQATAGAGGMGEVYRARDTRLDRTVAIKVLPAQFSSNAALKQRFEREAKTISALNHPNICHLYDVGHQDGIDFLVMEFVEGESLAERIARGPLPLAELVKVGVQIADALAKAHRSGIVHRDLKPANVMLTKSGAKLLDFGLAKGLSELGTGMSGGSSAPLLSAAKTMTGVSPHSPLTTAGTIVGTVQYMSPEQIEGKEADARSDIFALGALLYEMATGKRAFEGKSQLSVASAILEKDPEPMTRLAPLTPPGLEHIVQRALAKDPDERWQSAADVSAELRWVTAVPSQSTEAPFPRRARPARWVWTAAALVIGALFAIGGMWLARRAPQGTMYFASPFPFAASDLAMSPDGKTVALVAYVEQTNRYAIYVYEVGKSSATSVPGTEGASHPFWSPDGKSLAFFADGNLKRIDLPNGSPQILADAPRGRGGAWSPDGVILFSPDVATGLYKVPAGGGTPIEAVPPDPSQGHISLRWPVFLPDGRHFLFLGANFGGRFEKNGIMLGSLDSRDTRSIVTASSNVVYAQGCLLYLRDGVLVAQQFDPKSYQLRGEPHALADGIQYFPEIDLGIFTAAGDGAVIFQTGERGDRSQLVWFGRDGKPAGTVGTPGLIANPSISPDGRRVAFEAIDNTGRNADIWVQDMASGAMSRLTFGPGLNEMPAWSGDGKRIAHSANQDMNYVVAVKNADGSGADVVIGPNGVPPQGVWDWSRDGSYLLLLRRDHLWYMRSPGGDAKPLLTNDATVRHARFSPDNRWIAYSSRRNGSWEVYVSSFPDGTSTWQVSKNGGQEPRWRRDGKELFYLTPDGTLTAVPVKVGPTFEAGSPAALFVVHPRQPRSGLDLVSYDVTADGKKFVFNSKVEDHNSAPLSVILNWSAQLK